MHVNRDYTSKCFMTTHVNKVHACGPLDMCGPYFSFMKHLPVWSDRARKQAFQKWVYVLMSTLGKKNGAIEFLSVRGFF